MLPIHIQLVPSVLLTSFQQTPAKGQTVNISSFAGYCHYYLGFPGGARVEEPTCQCRGCNRHGFSSWVRRIPWRRAQQPTPVFLPREAHGQKRLVGYDL